MRELRCLLPILVCLAAVTSVRAAEEPGQEAAAAAQEHERGLTKAERVFYERRIAAHEAYLDEIRRLKREHLEAGSLPEARELEQREREVKTLLDSDRAELVRKQHALLSPAKVLLEGSGFEMKVLRNGATAYANRDYKWQNVPQKLRGWRYTQIQGGDTPTLRLAVRTDGVIHAMAEGHELEVDGWTRHPDRQFQWYPGRHPMAVFTREVKAGTTVDVPHHGWTGTMILLPESDQDASANET